jgi:hypothetical protein
VIFVFALNFARRRHAASAARSRSKRADEMRRAHMKTKTALRVDYENGGGKAL